MNPALREEHPEYISRKAMWKKYRDLYVGGERLRGAASEYLARRQKEPLDVYHERLSRVFYENYVGSIIDWYAASLFRREPVLTFDGSNEHGRQFFREFTDDCDLKGTSLTDFFRRQLVEALVCGASYVLVDFPRFRELASSRADEDARGMARAYLLGYRAEEIINWSLDGYGQYNWVVTRTSQMRKFRAEDSEWVTETRWVYYDRENFQAYRSVMEGGEPGPADLVDEGRHGLAKQKRVPLFELTVSDGLWLMNKAGLLQLEHFNKSNALSWALTMGLYAMPVIYSDREWHQVVGESYYIQLGPADRFGWTEPEGKVYQIAAHNLDRLQEEIYRVCYLLSQAGTGSLGRIPQSGLSKQRDFAITQEVLRAYGDSVKDTMKRVLRAVEAAREDGLRIDVSGLDEFDIGDYSTELTDGERLLTLSAGAKTLRRQVLKKLAFQFLCDVRQEVKDQIAKEIEALGD